MGWDMKVQTKTVPFTKYTGAGNDFIIIKDENYPLSEYWIKKACDRRYGIGADGLILVKSSNIATFKIVYFNSDGKEASFCGNGTRCVADYMRNELVWSDQCTIETSAGLIKCFENINGTILVKLPKIKVIGESKKFEINGSNFESICIECGVPHWIVFVDNVRAIDVNKWGKILRNDKSVGPDGANVNFVEIVSPDSIHVRTYERGVEAETLSCGSGCASASYVYYFLTNQERNKVVVETESHEHLLYLFHEDKCLMSGPTMKVFIGTISLDS